MKRLIVHASTCIHTNAVNSFCSGKQRLFKRSSWQPGILVRLPSVRLENTMYLVNEAWRAGGMTYRCDWRR